MVEFHLTTNGESVAKACSRLVQGLTQGFVRGLAQGLGLPPPYDENR
jgi:hypothetical protein